MALPTQQGMAPQQESSVHLPQGAPQHQHLPAPLYGVAASNPSHAVGAHGPQMTAASMTVTVPKVPLSGGGPGANVLPSDAASTPGVVSTASVSIGSVHVPPVTQLPPVTTETLTVPVIAGEQAGTAPSDQTASRPSTPSSQRARSRSRSPRRGMKAPRSSLKTCSTLTPETWTIRQAKNAGPNRSLTYWNIWDRDNGNHFSLTEGSETSKIVFRIGPSTYHNATPPSWYDGNSPHRPDEPNYFDINFALNDTQVQALNAVDTWAKKMVFDRSKDIFGFTMTEKQIEDMFKPSVKSGDEYPQRLRTRLVLAGREDLFTPVFVLGKEHPGGHLEGSGWDFVKEHLGEQKWRDRSCRVRLCVNSIQIMTAGSKSISLQYRLQALVIDGAETRCHEQGLGNGILLAPFAEMAL